MKKRNLYNLRTQWLYTKPLAILLATVILLHSGAAGFTRAVFARSLDDAFQAAGQELPAEERYVRGMLRAVFENSYEGVKGLQVLCNNEKETLLFNPECFNGYLNSYRYEYDASEKVGQVFLRSRSVAFQAGSSSAMIGMGTAQAGYTMSAPAHLQDDELWVPADDLLYLTGVDSTRIATDGDESRWEPEADFAIFSDPKPFLPDLLYEVFQNQNGTGWMFTYEDDLGLTEKQINDKENAAQSVTLGYALLTADIAKLKTIGTLPFTSLYNIAAQKITGSDAANLAHDYEEASFRRFIDAMVTPTEEVLELILTAADTGTAAMNFWYEVLSEAEGQEIAAVMDDLEELYGHSAAFDNIVEQAQGYGKQLSGGIDAAGKALGVCLNTLGYAMSCQNLVQQVEQQDELMLTAVEAYTQKLSQNPERSGMGTGTHKALEKAKDELLTQNKHIENEMVREFFNRFSLDAAVAAAEAGAGKIASFAAFGLGIASTVTSLNSAIWSGLELIDLPCFASVEEPEAFLTSLYGIVYAANAYSQLIFDYSRYTAYNDFSNPSQIYESSLLALNYLKACLVVRETAMKAFESAHIEETGAYRSCRSQCRQLAALIDDFAQALGNARENGKSSYDAIGLPFIWMETYDNPYTYDLFIRPSSQEDGVTYMSKVRDLSAPGRHLLPLVSFILTKEEVTEYMERIGFTNVLTEDMDESEKRLLPEYTKDTSEPGDAETAGEILYTVSCDEAGFASYRIRVNAETGWVTAYVPDLWEKEIVCLLPYRANEEEPYPVLSISEVQTQCEAFGYQQVEVSPASDCTNGATVLTYENTWLSYTPEVDRVTGIANVTFQGGDSLGYADLKNLVTLSGSPVTEEAEPLEVVYPEGLSREEAELAITNYFGADFMAGFVYSDYDRGDGVLYWNKMDPFPFTISVDSKTGEVKYTNQRGVILDQFVIE